MSINLGRCSQYLICPVCGAGLSQVDQTLKCPQAHSFDIAREGYVNLLLARRRKPKTLGDAREMLQARRRFLDRTLYAPLSDAINEIVHDHLATARDLADRSPLCVAEIGCGEGYYLGRLKRHLDNTPEHGDACYFGLDISKEAARLAARRYKGIWFFVADANQRILLSNNSTHVLLNVFAPRNGAEFQRVVVEGGLLLTVIPGPDHLAGARSELALLGIEAEKRDKVVEQFAGGFELVSEQAVAYEMHLGGEALRDLVQMTPSYWHIPGETSAQLAALESIHATASFTLLEFRRSSSLG